MCKDRWWNNTDKGNQMYVERNNMYFWWLLNECVWSFGGMLLTGENRSTWR